MAKTLKKRAVCLNLVKSITKDQGFFTITDIIRETDAPRSTIQDWVNRLVNEGYINLQQEAAGSRPAKYFYSLKSDYPATACKNIFTCLDRVNNLVEIYHFCGSEGCTTYCAHAHEQTGGVITSARHDGVFLRELAKIGSEPLVGLGSKSAVGIEELHIEGDQIVQLIKASGGPAYSLTQTMGGALGVKRIEHIQKETYIEGKIFTDILEHVTIGIDDTDDSEDGATWATSLSLLNNLKKINRIAHKIVFLNPNIPFKTLGNNAAFIEFALYPSDFKRIMEDVQNFVGVHTYSEQTAIAVMRGRLIVPDELKRFANEVRQREVSIEEAEKVAQELDIDLIKITGERGKIGALASIAFLREKPSCLLSAETQIKV